MARFSAGNRTGAGTTARPIISLYGTATAGQGRIVEIGVFNTTTTAVALKLVRLSTAGTSSAIATIGKFDPLSPAAVMSPRQTHTADATATDLGHYFNLGAAIGSGVILTFQNPIVVPTGTANGVGVLLATGTGQVCDAYVVWDE